MNTGEKKNNRPLKKTSEHQSDGSRELDDSALEDVAGGIAWHGRPNERDPTARWDKRDEW